MQRKAKERILLFRAPNPVGENGVHGEAVEGVQNESKPALYYGPGENGIKTVGELRDMFSDERNIPSASSIIGSAQDALKQAEREITGAEAYSLEQLKSMDVNSDANFQKE
eukprot:9933381-Prorocentrum_lima.AAC.1